MISDYKAISVWLQDEDDNIAIERVQKSALRMILDSEYIDYKSALFLTHVETLRSRRKYDNEVNSTWKLLVII